MDHVTLRVYVTKTYGPARAADRPKSWKAERGAWRRILRGLGHVRLRDVNGWIVHDWLGTLKCEQGARKGLPCSGNTKRLYKAAIIACMTFAFLRRHIRRFPRLVRVDGHRVFVIRDSTVPVRPDPDPLDLREVVALIESARTTYGHKVVAASVYRVRWALGAGAGLRPSERARVAWEHIRWEKHTMLVVGDATGMGKTRASVAEIPMTPLAERELRRRWDELGRPSSGLVLGVDDAGVASADRKALRNAARRAGITRRVSPYLLRHSFATIAWSLGIPMDVTRRILRHCSDAMLQRVYCRPRPEDLVKFVQNFDVHPADPQLKLF